MILTALGFAFLLLLLAATTDAEDDAAQHTDYTDDDQGEPDWISLIDRSRQ